MTYSLLHDHLDGGLRPSTIIELVKINDIKLPVEKEEPLRDWFYENINTNLNQVFHKFDLTISVMQSKSAIQRVAYEAVEDLRKDNVEYAELRYAPLQHLREGLLPSEVVESVYRGITQGIKDHGGNFKSILCAMRQDSNSYEVAQLALESKNYGVVGFDLAGPENLYPPSLHKKACDLISNSDLGLTIHAGEAAEFSYIEEAVFLCNVQRIGHGWQIIEGCQLVDNLYIPMKDCAKKILDEQISLEICLTSNVKSGASYIQWDSHPGVRLLNSGFNVSFNTDNRLMANTTISNEFALAKDKLGLDSTLEKKAISNSVKSKFNYI